MGKGHARNEDTYLNKGGANEVTAANAKDAVDKKHTQNTDTKLDNGGINAVTAAEIVTNIYNTILVAFKVAIQGALTLFDMIDGIVDEYVDESGIDTINSINQTYDAVNDLYTNVAPDTEVKLLLHLDNNITDSSNYSKTVTNSNVTFSDSIYKWGYSGVFNGTSAKLTLANSADWDFGTGNFTIDFWVYKDPIQDTVVPGLITSMTNGNQNTWQLGFPNGLPQNIRFVFNGVNPIISSIPLVDNTWTHVALVRNSNTVTLYIGGQNAGTWDATGVNINSAGAGIGIGLNMIDVNNYYFRGCIDEVRVVKGAAKWTAPFTPPTSPHSFSALDMTLLSEIFIAEDTPSNARIVILEEDIDSVTLNTDLKAFISRDGGVHWSEVTLTQELESAFLWKVCVASIDISSQDIDTDMKYKIITYNNKGLRIRGTSLLWN